MGERELRDFLTRQLAAGETLFACAYGVERKSRAERLGGLLGASLGGWIGGALVIDDGWGLATTSSRLFSVRMQRVARLLGPPKLRFGTVHGHADAQALRAAVHDHEREMMLELTLEEQRRSLRFMLVAGFPDNLQQARAIAEWLETRSRGGSSAEPGRY